MKKALTFILFLFFTAVSGQAFALSLSPAGKVSFDASDNSWFSHAGIPRVGFAGNGLVYSMDHDLSLGIHFQLFNGNGDKLFEEYFLDTYPKEIQVNKEKKQIFIFHTKPSQSKILSVYNLETGDLTYQTSKYGLKSYRYFPEQNKIFFANFEKIVKVDLETLVEDISTYNADKLRPFFTSDGIFYLKRIVGQSGLDLLDERESFIASIDIPHGPFLNSLKYKASSFNDRFFLLSNREDSKVETLIDVSTKDELITEGSNTVVSKFSPVTKAIAFFGSQGASLLDLDNSTFSSKNIGVQFLSKFTVDPETKKLIYWTFPGRKIVSHDFYTNDKEDVDFSCSTYEFSNDGKSVGCIGTENFQWWNIEE